MGQGGAVEIKQGEGDLEVHDTLQPRQLVLENGAVLLVEKHLEVTLQMEPNMTLQEAIQQRLQNGSTCSTSSMQDPQVRAHLAPPRLLLEAVTDLHRGLANGEVLSLIPALQAAEGPQAQQEMCTTEPGCAPPTATQITTGERTQANPSANPPLAAQRHLPAALLELHAEGEILRQRPGGRPPAFLERICANEEIGACGPGIPGALGLAAAIER